MWWPSASGDRQCAIELLDAHGETLPVALTLLQGGAVLPRRYRMSATKDGPAFARLRFPDGSVSAPAIVTAVDKLRETVREARGRRAESAALQLMEETEEGLWLWEIVNELEAAEAAQDGSGEPGTGIARGRKDKTEGETTYRTLDYEQFIAGRRLRSDDAGITRNSLAGTDLTLVRDFLNRILSIGDAASTEPVDDAALSQGLDLGDETGNAEDALEGGAEFSQRPEENNSAKEEAARRRAATRDRATREQIVSAVERFDDRIKTRAEAGQLTSYDVLRFRLILMIVAAAGQPGGMSSLKTTSLQVLPCDAGEEAWPRLMGRLAFTLFGGNRPAIRKLKVEATHDRVPDDLLECWATALWAVQACFAATAVHKGLQQNMETILHKLVQQTYARIRLRKEELESGRVADVFESLNARFAGRLGLDPVLIKKAHARTIVGQSTSVLTV